MAETSAWKYVSWTKNNDGVATMVIDNPPVNAFTGDVDKEIIACVQQMTDDPDVRAVVITGAGDKAFVAGADIKKFPDAMKGGPGAGKALLMPMHVAFNKIDAMPKPTIAAIHGFALGGGLELALVCDLRVAAENAEFGVPEIKLGLFPGAGATQRLPRAIGEARAKEMIYTGNTIKADEAYRIGLINKVVPAGKDVEAAQELGKFLAKQSLSAIALAKDAIDRGSELTVQEGIEIEVDNWDKAFFDQDAKEGIDAFVNKRRPNFRRS